MGDNLSPSDVRAVVDASNDARGFAYPYPMYGGGFGNSGFGGDSSSFFGTNWSANDGSLFGDIQGIFGGGASGASGS